MYDSYYSYVTGILNPDPSVCRTTHYFNIIALGEIRTFLPCKIYSLIFQLSSSLIIAREVELCVKHTRNFPLHGFMGNANKSA